MIAVMFLLALLGYASAYLYRLPELVAHGDAELSAFDRMDSGTEATS